MVKIDQFISKSFFINNISILSIVFIILIYKALIITYIYLSIAFEKVLYPNFPKQIFPASLFFSFTSAQTHVPPKQVILSYMHVASFELYANLRFESQTHSVQTDAAMDEIYNSLM